jgi:hypothetical protein
MALNSCSGRIRTRLAKLALFSAVQLVLFCTGCMHRPIQINRTYTLEGAPEYPLLVPSTLQEKVDDDFQLSLITLTSDPNKTDSTFAQRCSINGPIFSLTPSDPARFDRWYVKSPSVQGWQKNGGEINTSAEWNRFTHDLLLLEHQGCFPLKESVSAITRTVVENIPFPASESLLFFYSLSGAGFVDLVPGMQIRIERTLFDSVGPKQNAANYRGSVDAQYEVVPLPQTGVALRLSKTENRRSGKALGTEASLIFGLPSRFASKPMLRLFLESIGSDKTNRASILIGATNASDLATATRQIESNQSVACPVASPAEIDCVSFNKGTAVSLLSSLWINGRLLYLPLGTSLYYVVETVSRSEHGQARALETISLRRPLATGGYAEVIFPRSLTSAQQVILLSGDRLTWEQ